MGKVGFIPLTPHPAGIFLVLPLPSPSKIPLWLFLGFPLGSAHLKVKFPSAPANPMGSLSLEFPIPGMFKARLEQPGILEWDKIPFLPQPFQDSGILGLLPKFKHSPGIFPNSKQESTSHPWAPAALGCSHPHSQEEFCHGRAAFPNSQMPNSSWEGKLGEAGALPDFFPPSHHSSDSPCAAFPPLPNSSFIPEAAPDGRNSNQDLIAEHSLSLINIPRKKTQKTRELCLSTRSAPAPASSWLLPPRSQLEFHPHSLDPES